MSRSRVSLLGSWKAMRCRPCHGRAWAGVRNGELLGRAATEFDVFVTVDQNLQHQQNLGRFPVAVAVLVVHDNRIETLEPLAPLLLSVLPSLQAGRATEITR